ncbi:unnamed protein product [Oppiella nova]|uniref:C2H2-type domain-containing protein n=1 Tax=Oppiella nova TaxID=334625 RepID=A0A7R9QM57_9ACAR|nr:unnamed protein product [Oppiella nova]CAG2167776.1 unnamed protein product [Oppiella nova]
MLPKPRFDSINANTNSVGQSSHTCVNYNQSYGENNRRNADHNHKRSKSYGNTSDHTSGKTNDTKKTLNCDACCRWFTSQDLYDQHMSEHIMCGLDECTFRAHPKVIESHQRMQHLCFRDKTLVKKFMSLESEEDIQKWREERRRHFPTKDNIKQKEELKERQRLEDMETRKQLAKERESERQRTEERVDHKSDHCLDKNSKFNKNNRNTKQMKAKQRLQPLVNNNRKLTLFQKNGDNEEKITESIDGNE